MNEPSGQLTYRFDKTMRVRTQEEFDRVFAPGGAYQADPTLVVNAVTNDLGRSRLGLAVSKKVGKANVRNCWKRVIREAFRLEQHDLPRGLDLVVRPRKGAEPDFTAVRKSLRRLAERLARTLLRSSG